MSTIPGNAWVSIEPNDPPELENEPGNVDIERTDTNEVAIHWTHPAEDQATVSLYLTKRGALKVAHLLLAEAEDV